MPRPSPATLCLALLVASAAALPSGAVQQPAAPAGAEQPLQLEDVVRRFVGGTPAAELVEWIRTSPVAFDVSDEMLDELALAGLPEMLIRAMVERQAEMEAARSPEPATPTRAAATAGLVRFHLYPPESRKRLRQLRIGDQLAPEVAAQWQLPDTPEARKITDVALYVVCRTAYHVPDHWRGKSPLGRDFVSMPRHRVIAFFPGAEWTAAGLLQRIGLRAPAVRPSGSAEDPGAVVETGIEAERRAAGRLEFDLPRVVEVELEPGEPHDVSLGLALKVGGRFYRLGDVAYDGLTVSDGETNFAVRVEGLDRPGPPQFEIEKLPADPRATEPAGG